MIPKDFSEVDRSSGLIPKSVEFLVRALHRTTLAFLEEMMDQLDRWTYETRFHSYRVSVLSCEIGKKMDLNPDQMMSLRAGALLHDIGKIRIPQDILNKPGALTCKEWSVIRQHPEAGRSMLSRIPSLAFAKELVHQHHERWNGTGYPRQLSGSDILLEARIFGVIDSYDAMISHRAYNTPKLHEEAVGEIRKNSGILFDPDVVKSFLSLSRENFWKVESILDHDSFLRDLFDPDEYLRLLIMMEESQMESDDD